LQGAWDSSPTAWKDIYKINEAMRGGSLPIMVATLDELVRKYTLRPFPALTDMFRQLERPYFVNFVLLVGREAANSLQSAADTNLILFQEVLVRLGFEQLNERPGLTRKLVLTTMFRMDYSDFVAQTAHHISGGLESTLRSWIDETGALFKFSLPMLLYYLWEQGLHTNEIRICTVVPPLIDPEELKRIYDLCERIYFDIEVSRLQLTLEHFDPSAFLTMFTLDAMKGYEFEEFLGSLLTTIGYDVQVTKRSGDQGADLFAERFGKKIVIQAKNYNDTVGNAAVQQVLAAKLFYGSDEAMVITNSYFTASAKELGESTGVRLVDRTQLQVYLDEYNQTMAQGCKASSLSQED